MKKYFAIFLCCMLLPFVANAADSEGLIKDYAVEIVLGIAVLVCFVVLLVLVVVLQAMKVVLRTKEDAQEETESAWQKLVHSLTKSVPVSAEEEIMTDHAYDGIKELDNRLPPWWLYGFYFTIIFGIGYVAYYHVFSIGALQEEEYVLEVAAAEQQIEEYLATLENSIDETNVVLNLTKEEITIGQDLYGQNCVACHGALGEGGVGPNLTDSYWLHGGSIKDIFKTIKYGVPEKGMISWQNKFTPKQMQQISSYIISLDGTAPPNGKEPQGELYERKEEEPSQEEKITEEKDVATASNW